MTTVAVTGPVTLAEVARWRDALSDGLARGQGLRLDLAGSGPWDLAGVQLLLAAIASGKRAGTADRPGTRPERFDGRCRARGAADQLAAIAVDEARRILRSAVRHSVRAPGLERVPSVNDRFLSLFFEEAHELLQALEAGLMDLELRQGDREHLDRTFRAAHTLKGAAGMVGLRPIAEFTHKVEAVLDDIRSGRMAVTRGAITILLRAKDHSAPLWTRQPEAGPLRLPPTWKRPVGLKVGDLPTEPDRSRPPAAGIPSPTNRGGRSPSRAASAAEAVSRRYRIEFRPRPDLLRKGIDPLGFLDELRELGDARITAQARPSLPWRI